MGASEPRHDIGPGWTDERVDLLKKLWHDGLSASQMAKVLGHITRNAVIGKASRLGLTGRAKPSAPDKAVRAARPAPLPARVPAVARPSPQLRPVIALSPDVAPRGPGRTVEPVVVPFRDAGPGLANSLTVGGHMCRWPIGSPDEAGFTFCGQRQERGSYCALHAGIAFAPATKRRPSADDLARSLRRYV